MCKKYNAAIDMLGDYEGWVCFIHDDAEIRSPEDIVEVRLRQAYDKGQRIAGVIGTFNLDYLMHWWAPDRQVNGVGYSFVEVVATCPTNWGMTPQNAFQWLRDNMLPYYPLGVYKDVVADGFANAAEAALERAKDCPIAQQKKEA